MNVGINKRRVRSTNGKRPLVGVDLFAGAGGLSLGFEQAGFNIKYAIEYDKHAAETYRRNREANKDLIVDTRDIKDIKEPEWHPKLSDYKE